MSTSSVYIRDGDWWVPNPEAKGPFPGQHGGAVAGVLAVCLEAEAMQLNAGVGLQCSTILLRPMPLERCKVAVSTVRAGGRVTVLAAALSVDGTDCAHSRAIFVRESEVGHWPLPADELYRPADCEVVPKPARFGATVWFRDTVEIRRAQDIFWLRSMKPVAEPFTPLAQVCAHADWSSGLSRHDNYDSPKLAGFPNADLSIHLSRSIKGEWVGLRPKSYWYTNGMGMADTEILDIYGPLGRACHTLVLMPLRSPHSPT
jgi:hypothetical protein